MTACGVCSEAFVAACCESGCCITDIVQRDNDAAIAHLLHRKALSDIEA